MFGILSLLFLVVPLVELYVLIQVGSVIGGLETVGILLAMGLLGAWLMKREGLGVYRRVQRQLAAGEMPGPELVDGFLILFGGLLLLAPGFLTDLVGLALLLPPVRAVVRRVAATRITTVAVTRIGGRPPSPRRPPADGVIDV